MSCKFRIRRVENSFWLLISFLLMCFFSCRKESMCDKYTTPVIKAQGIKTKNVFIIVADGLRYSESWGDTTHQYIPKMGGYLSSLGVTNSNFYNLGDTYTTAGHINLTTGFYQTIDNTGMELPAKPSIFQYWIKTINSDPLKSWVIASKGKLAILGNSNDSAWNGKYTPSVNCGTDGMGIGSGLRNDSLTLLTTFEILKANHPHLVLVNFMEPDNSGHSGIWDIYTRGIRKTDENIYQLWQFLQKDSIYHNTTAIFVTSDHGRHLDNIYDGFASHGDGCEGCRHLSFLAIGPDFKQGMVTHVAREQIDIPVTIAYILGFSIPTSKGQVMTELFSNYKAKSE